MSVAYLQRLFDRAAATAAPQVAPAGSSLSPVVEADQRLNAPEFAADFSFASPSDDGVEGEETPELAPGHPRRAVGRARAEPPQSPPRPRELSAPATTEGTSPRQVRRPAPVEAPFGSVGEVLAEDFVRPEALDGAEPPIVEPPRPPAPRRLAALLEPVTLEESAAAQPRATRAAPEPTARVAPVVEDAPTPARPAPAVAPEPEDPSREEPAERSADARASDGAAPVVMIPPRPAPAPAPPPEPPLSEREALRSPPPRPRIVRQETRIEAATPDRPAARRPMTAAEASVIGPLIPEPRARTLFGLRRR